MRARFHQLCTGKKLMTMASTETNPNCSRQDHQTSGSKPEGEKVEAQLSPKSNSQPQSDSIFQAVGIVTKTVNLMGDSKNTVTIGDSTYPLFYLTHKRKAFDALKLEIATTGNLQQRLIVYPKVTHFPSKQRLHQIAFQLVGFDKGQQLEGVSGELLDLEFKLSGLWQFIPVCRTPCISIFRNFSRERLDYIKQAQPVKKVKFLKACHLPLLWKDAPSKPFRFNLKAEADRGHPIFVSLKAKFLPERNVFGFVEQLAPLQETAPRFLKASKQDKASLLQRNAPG